MRSQLLLLTAGVFIGLGIGAVILFGFGPGRLIFTRWIGSAWADAPSLVPEINRTASDFELETLSGEKIHLADLRGKPVVINFWATWCGPCRIEMPLLQKYYDLYSPDVAVLAINYDEPVEKVRSYIEELGLSFPILLDPHTKVENLYYVRAFPTTFFLDADGIIRYQHIGALNEAQLAAYLDQIGVSP
jgi:thiol-disulfide isomerase/thioredoxin